VRFVYLKKKLKDFIPPTSQIWDDSIERRNEINALRKTILVHNDIYENDEMRVYPRSQKELFEEGFDEEKERFVGAKWGKYLRAPEIFFEVLKKCKNKLVYLKDLAKIRRGFTTGANEFFYLTEKEIQKRKIEKQFWMHKDENDNWIPNYIVKSPRECKGIVIEPKNLKLRVLLIRQDKKKLKNKNILGYIGDGEHKNFDKRSTFNNREDWYDLGKRPFGDAAWIYVINDRFVTFQNISPKVYLDCELFDIFFNDKEKSIGLLAYLNSTISVLFAELNGRTNLGQGALKVQVYEVQRLLAPKIEYFDKKTLKRIEKVFEKLSAREIGSIFEELGANSPEEVAFEKVKKDRLELDKIMLQDILGLNEVEHLEIYQSVIDLVDARLSRAKSVQKRSKKKGGSVGDAMTGNLSDEYVNGD
jgi:hypothetical protein